MSKKINLFIDAMSSGGAEHQLSILANELVRRQYDVTVMTMSDSEDHYSLDSRISRVRIAPSKGKIQKIFSLYSYLLQTSIDCIICFGARESAMCMPALWLKRDTVVISGERCATFGKIPFYKKCNYYLFYRRSDYIVPNSYTQQDDLSQISKSIAKKLHVITNYTNTEEFKFSAPQHNTPIKIGIFGRYSLQKNCIRFVEAIKVLKHRVSIPFEIDWYGNKENNPYYESMNNKVVEYSLENVINLHNHTKDVARLLPTFDVMCLPSIGEGFSNSISEYISCGKPVLCSDVADNSVMVHHGVNGFLFDPFNIESIVSSFEEFFNLSREDVDNMCFNSRRIAEDLFDINKYVESYIALFNKKNE